VGIATEVGAQVGEVAVSLEGALGEDPLEEVVQPLAGKGIKTERISTRILSAVDMILYVSLSHI
jgi:hypothetical protein